MKLNFTFAALKDIEEGVKRLCVAMKELMVDNENDEIYPDVEINPIV